MMTTNEYKQGWYDGYQAAKNEIKFYPTVNTTPVATSALKNCKVCGLSFTNPDGSFKTLGYVCTNDKCPTKITWSHPGVPAASSYAIVGGGGGGSSI